MIINHNITALNTYNRLNKNNKNTSNSIEKLSSGLRINKASDDSAGLATSEKMRAQIRGLQQAQRNIQDGISLVQTAEAGLGEIENPNLQRLRELAIQSANDTLTTEDRQEIQNEVNQIRQGINEIANNTEFNQIPLLNISNTILQKSTKTKLSVIGGSETQLTSQVRYDHQPNWVSANEILFVGNANSATNYEGDIFKMDSSGGKQNKIITEGASPTSSNDGQKIAFVRDKNLFVSDINGNNQIQITNSADMITDGQEYQSAIAWSPDDKYLYFSTDSGIEKIEVSNTNNRSVVIEGSNLLSPSVSPDGSKVIYQKDENIYIADNDGNNVSFLSNGIEPVFSPDGSKIAFTDKRAEVTPQISHIMVMDIAGTNIQNITENMPTANLHFHNHRPTWSPDGTQIAFHSDLTNGLSGKIWKVNLQSTSFTVTTPIKNLNKDLNLQVGANSGDQFWVERTDVRTSALGIGDIDLSTRDGAVSAISKIDKALETVSSERGKFGSYQNRLKHTLNNAFNYEINLTSAESRIRDADVAKQMIELTKHQILSQSSQSMLTQASLLPQQVLQLLK